MSRDGIPDISGRLCSQIRSYSTRRLSIGDETEELDRVLGVGARTAVVLLCGRILEGLASQALDTAGLRPSSNLAANLETLRHLSLLGRSDAYWANALRRLANESRHLVRRMELEDGLIALSSLALCLQWFFGRFQLGPRLTEITVDGSPLVPSTVHPSASVWNAVFQPGVDPDVLLIRNSKGELLKPATVPSVIAEMLIDRARYEVAEALLTQALTVSPKDLRLRQLLALVYSRSNRLALARKTLEALRKEGHSDGETTGILAGVLKRAHECAETVAKTDRTAGCGKAANATDALLQKSWRLYREGWLRSDCQDTYLGINAASQALIAGRRDEARDIAGLVLGTLAERDRLLRSEFPSGEVALDYWGQVTMAEAELILEQFESAAGRYREAFERHASLQGDIQVAGHQANRILASLGYPSDLEHLMKSR